VAFPPGRDRREPLTLRFVDRELEQAYQHDDAEDGIRSVRTASLVAIGNWIVVAVLAPLTLGIAAGPTWLICGAMVIVSLGAAAMSRWATTQGRREAIGLGQQLVAGTAVLVLTAVTGTFAGYAMPGIMLTAVFGFAITRHAFVGAVGVGIAYVALFLAFGLALDVGAPLWLQAFIVAATVVAGCVGAYLLDASQRTTYAQGRLVESLRARVDQLLHHYLSPDVAAALIADPGRAALGGDEVEVTVLFADLRGYTAYAERLAPSVVVAMLNDAFGAVVPIVLEQGGTVVQFMGDAMMAIFNAPNRQADHAVRAARTALEMQQAAAALPGAGDRPQFRVGINTGPALVGNVGAAEVRTFSAIGDATNLAARLQTFAPPGSVVISGSTYERLDGRATVRPLGTPALKGKSESVEAFELVALRAT
jgi:class 3 adenylate cyclase